MSEPGVILYRGPSMLNGEPIVCVLTGLDGGSKNAKTGSVIQSWIVRSDMSPMDAVRANLDDAVCGDCQLRGNHSLGRRCYVPVWFAPNNVYKHIDSYIQDASWADLQALVEGRTIRLGAYGDPACVPIEVWNVLLVTAAGWIGYTHAWRTCDPRFKTICMASVDDEREFYQAGLRGWRTFRIRQAHDPLIAGAEFVCPASDEAGHRTTCQACQLCRGTSSPARSVAIVAHGNASSLKAYGVAINGRRVGRPRKQVESTLGPPWIQPTATPLLRAKFYRSRAEVRA